MRKSRKSFKEKETHPLLDTKGVDWVYALRKAKSHLCLMNVDSDELLREASASAEFGNRKGVTLLRLTFELNTHKITCLQVLGPVGGWVNEQRQNIIASLQNPLDEFIANHTDRFGH